jgi:hypothetical protein
VWPCAQGRGGAARTSVQPVGGREARTYALQPAWRQAGGRAGGDVRAATDMAARTARGARPRRSWQARGAAGVVARSSRGERPRRSRHGRARRGEEEEHVCACSLQEDARRERTWPWARGAQPARRRVRHGRGRRRAGAQPARRRLRRRRTELAMSARGAACTVVRTARRRTEPARGARSAACTAARTMRRRTEPARTHGAQTTRRRGQRGGGRSRPGAHGAQPA